MRYAITTSASASRLRFVVDGCAVVEVFDGESPSEEVVYRGCDLGSAHAVARALQIYRLSGGLSVGAAAWQRKASYEVVRRSRA